MELEKDLLIIDRKSRFQTIFGIAAIGFTMILIIFKFQEDQSLTLLEWLQFVSLFLMGVIHLIAGTGYSLAKLFGKSFVKINDTQISIKPGVFDKEQAFYWTDIKSIIYETNRYKIIDKENLEHFLNLLKIEYDLKQQIKAIIQNLATAKNIAIS